MKLIRGEFVQEFRQNYSSWLSQTFRLYNDSSHIEVEITINPMPIDDNMGKELITRFTTPLATNQLYYTDANGMEFQQRRRNFRATWPVNMTDVVSGNYYPINTAAYIQDTNKNMQLTIIVDRSEGGTSLVDGQFDVMLQRRLLDTDGFGTNEALNETLTIRVVHYILLDPIDTAAQHHRKLVQMMTNPVQILFAKPSRLVEWKGLNPTFEPMNVSLPQNIRLETFKTLPTGDVLLRLHHLYAINEDENLSANITVDISTLFNGIYPVKISEMTLTANRPIEQLHRLKWITNESTETQGEEENSAEINNFQVELSPMEIRTFLVRFEKI